MLSCRVTNWWLSPVCPVPGNQRLLLIPFMLKVSAGMLNRFPPMRANFWNAWKNPMLI